MQNKLKIAVAALCYTPLAFAQSDSIWQKGMIMGETAYTFTEAQLGGNDDMAQNVPIINSKSNIYASEAGFLFSPTHFRYRAFDPKYNETYINGTPVNDIESGQFRYSWVDGLSLQTRNMDSSLPFEGNGFATPAMGGSNNYDFRPTAMPAGHRLTLSGANRNYTLGGMYAFNSGLTRKGWAFSASVAYHRANEGYVEGTFYNSLSYFLGAQKLFGNGGHSLSFVTWGNPTERAAQGASTDEAYELTNNKYYNPYWGYQNGKKRNSRVIHDFAPSALLTWDWKIDGDTKLTTSLLGRYAMYKGTRLGYDNTANPLPDYWSNMPSSHYDVWDETNTAYRTPQALADWNDARDTWTGSKVNRQINWNQLYYSNNQAAGQGRDAMYYVQAMHDNALTFTLASTLNKRLNASMEWNAGIIGSTNKCSHYLTMEDLLGAKSFHNINTYAEGFYGRGADEAQYDLNRPDAAVGEDDKFGYDYRISVGNSKAWTSFSHDVGMLSYTVAGKIGYTSIERDGKMRNGLAPDNSYGKSKTKQFVDGGAKIGVALRAGRGHTLTAGAAYELRAPQARAAFAAPETNNDFAPGLKDEKAFSAEVGYQMETGWLHANVNAYYSRLKDVADWRKIYFDDTDGYSCISMTDIDKEYYGIEAGLRFRVAAPLDISLTGHISEAKTKGDSHARHTEAGRAGYADEIVRNDGMRDAGTPLTAASVGASYHRGGWRVDVNCNYYDRIYLAYSPCARYESVLHETPGADGWAYGADGGGETAAAAQAKGHGGFMVDCMIGRYVRIRRGTLAISLMLSNLLNNRNLCTGGYERSLSAYSGGGKAGAYSFRDNPMKFYAYGTSGMLNITYKF